ncbi:Soyasapogenol B glucuronide galactosyltransferase [Glycine soja]|uniref:Soyasapogenol B glucuronide galactosyltransferase n=1 Tax=Glycine soja TaxID=3848 RepID=A0A445M514_GLYSO|nr:Soyasapogenol B glucuronide galactosyltransferase [Glycine soja]
METVCDEKKLKVIFLPFLSTSHIIPIVDIARLFAMHDDVDVTIITSHHPSSCRVVPRFHQSRFVSWSFHQDPHADAAANLGIPRLMFLGGSYLSHSAQHSLKKYAPHHLEMTRLQKKKSYGSLFDTFYDLEGTYQEHYKTVTGTKTWSLGPVSLWVNQDASDKAGRGYAKEEGWLKWLKSKPEKSVLYVSFGSMSKFPSSQLVEIAQALEESGHSFMWVVKNRDEGDDRFLEEFEKRVKASNKGYLIWGWAPQLLILENSAIGGLVTHCGWNTIMEGVTAGLPMATWPLFAEQFFNEKPVVDVLKIGVAVGAKEWRPWNDFGKEVVKKEDIGKAIALLMGSGEESAEMRRKAVVLATAAKTAIQVGGSSHTNMLGLIQELKSLRFEGNCLP